MPKSDYDDNMVVLELDIKFDSDESIRMSQAEFELVLRHSIKSLYGLTGEAMRYELMKFDSTFEDNIILRIKKKDEERIRASLTLCRTAAEVPVAINVVSSRIDRSER